MINFKEASGRFFYHFQEVVENCIEYIRIFFIHFREISKFWSEVTYFRRILWLISWSLQDDQGGITRMNTCKVSLFDDVQVTQKINNPENNPFILAY